MNEQCRNCRFSKSFGTRLICRRYPPRVASRSEHGDYPRVLHDEWCGEWMSMRRGAGLPATIAPPPDPRGVLMAESARRIERAPPGGSPQSLGGKARATKLAPARRAEIAQIAATARWSKKPDA